MRILIIVLLISFGLCYQLTADPAKITQEQFRVFANLEKDGTFIMYPTLKEARVESWFWSSLPDYNKAVMTEKAAESITPAGESPRIIIKDKNSGKIVGEYGLSAAAPRGEENLTGPQQNAVRSANQYLKYSGFSRTGLIDQLSSDYGDGYEVADATIAVDSLNIDWNKQAVRSAKEYVKMMGFSCKGLIDQLSSDYGNKYTVSQATYGARQTSACQ